MEYQPRGGGIVDAGELCDPGTAPANHWYGEYIWVFPEGCGDTLGMAASLVCCTNGSWEMRFCVFGPLGCCIYTCIAPGGGDGCFENVGVQCEPFFLGLLQSVELSNDSCLCIPDGSHFEILVTEN